MRIAVAGLGSAARRGHLPAIGRLAAEGRAELVGGCDIDPRRLAPTSRLARGIPRFTDVAELLGATNPDLLVVATEPSAHLSGIRHGLRHGCDTLCEKPVVIDHDGRHALTSLRAEHPGVALVPVHQYRYSPGWRHLAGWAATVHQRSGAEPLRCWVQVRRDGTDPRAGSPWRDDPRNGGGLADHVVHFLALAAEVLGPMRACGASRTVDRRGRETVRGQTSSPVGTLDVEVDYAAGERHTTLALCCGAERIRWRDGETRWYLANRCLGAASHPALSDRAHVDGLYLPLYREIAERRGDRHWSELRWRESLDTSALLADLSRLAAHRSS